MYRYDEFDRAFVHERVTEFRDQVDRRLSGELSEDQFKPLRLMNGVYLQLHAYMLRIAIPYGTLSSRQLRQLAAIARDHDRGYGHFTTRQNLQFNWIALKDVPEVWEISYDPKAEDVPIGVIHDFLYKEGAFIPGYLNPRRTFLSEPLDDFFFTQDYSELMGASREAGKGQVVNLDVRRKIADLSLPGMPHLGSGITWEWNGRPVMASPNLKEGVVSVIDMGNWQTVKAIPTLGPGFFMRSHEATPYAWTDAMMSKAKDTLQVIDKRNLEKVAEVKVAPGKTLAHIEFTRDGRHALASLWERKTDGGALVVFDAATFKEVKRIPMDKPVGKYNLHNKITRSAGTSH